MRKLLVKFFEKFYTNIYIVGVIVSIGLGIWLFGTPFAPITYVATGLCLSPLVTGHSKKQDSVFKMKQNHAQKIREIKLKHKILAYRELWQSGYKNSEITKFITKYDPKTLNTK